MKRQQLQLKPRSMGASKFYAQEAEQKADADAKDPIRLQAMLDEHVTLQRNAVSRKLRCEDLMRRKSAKKWDDAKKLQMVRRLMAAGNAAETAERVIEQLREQLKQPQTA